MTEQRLRLLLVAPACDRDDVGEAEVTYQWASRLAERHAVTILTYDKRDRRQSVADQIPGARVVQWSEPPLVGRFERLNSMLKPGYVPFYVRVRRWVRREAARGARFDLAHQLAPVALRYPSPLAGLGIPYVVGPVGGSLTSPSGFADEESGSPWYVSLRRVDGFRLRHDPLLRRGFAQAGAVLGIGGYVQESLTSVPLRAFAVMPDTGVAELPEAVDRTGRTAPLRLLFVGRLVRTKGVVDAVRALALTVDREATLDVVGTGYQRAECEQLVAELGLGDRVRFHGQVPRAAVDEFMRSSDVFLFPSYREPGGIAVVEAMSFGLACIVADRGGPAGSVGPAAGERVPVTDPVRYPTDLAAAVDRLSRDPDLRRSMGEAARARVAEQLLWERKVDALDRIYGEVTDANQRPRTVARTSPPRMGGNLG